MDYPEYAKVDNELYPINTDFRVAIRCNEVAQDKTIGDYERAMAIIYLLFGDKGLESKNKQVLLDKALYFLSCGKEVEKNDTNEKPDMDFVEDYDLIEASFMSDFHIDLSNTKMHWWKFNKLINGLSNSEMGNCCVLNRVRNLRTYDLSQISDSKERQKMRKAQEAVALKKNQEIELTEEQEQSLEMFYKSLKA